MKAEEGSASVPGEARATLMLFILFWAATFLVLSVRGIFYDQGPWWQVVPPRAAVTLAGALLCMGTAITLGAARRRSFPVLIALALAVTLLMSAVQSAVHIAIYDVWSPGGAVPNGPIGHVLWTLFWLGYFLAFTGTYLALLYHRTVSIQEQRLAAMRVLAQEAQIAALRYQINPHFLFNTINSISAFVLDSRREDAERMLVGFADFLRSTIGMDPAAAVTLDEEVALQRLYLDIEKVRFSNRMKVRIDVPVELGRALVPGLILQPLVENAVKHGVGRSDDETVIAIEARREADELVLAVSDDAAGDGAALGSGLGLRNVRERLEAEYGAAGRLLAGREESGFRAEVRIPLAFKAAA